MRLRELIFERISLLCKTIDDRASGIAQPHHLRTLVKRFAYRVINGLAEDFILQRAVDLDDLRIASRYEKTQIRELRLAVVRAFLLYEVGKYMSLKMIDFHKRLAERHGQSLGE